MYEVGTNYSINAFVVNYINVFFFKEYLYALYYNTNDVI